MNGHSLELFEHITLDALGARPRSTRQPRANSTHTCALIAQKGSMKGMDAIFGALEACVGIIATIGTFLLLENRTATENAITEHSPVHAESKTDLRKRRVSHLVIAGVIGCVVCFGLIARGVSTAIPVRELTPVTIPASESDREAIRAAVRAANQVEEK